jgi:hypothetical protein
MGMRMALARRFCELFDGAADTASSLGRFPPNAYAPRHRNDFWYVSIVVSGSFSKQSECFDNIAHTGELVVLPLGGMHEDIVGPQGSTRLNFNLSPKDAGRLQPHAGHLVPVAVWVAQQLALATAQPGTPPDPLIPESLLAELFDELSAAPEPHQARGVKQAVVAFCNDPRRRWSFAELAAVAARHRNGRAYTGPAATTGARNACCELG